MNEIIKDRECLQELREEAESEARIKGLSPSWKRVYLRLADAASELDAYIARSSDMPCPNNCNQPFDGCSDCPED